MQIKHKAQNNKYKKGLSPIRQANQEGRQAGSASLFTSGVVGSFAFSLCRLSSGILPNTTFCQSLFSIFLTVLAKRERLNYGQVYRNFVLKVGIIYLNLQIQEIKLLLRNDLQDDPICFSPSFQVQWYLQVSKQVSFKTKTIMLY